MKLLVFPCGSEVGLEIHRAFQGVRNVSLVGGSSVADHGEFVYAEYLGHLPSVNQPEFIPGINEAVVRSGCEYIYPAHDSVQLKLSQHVNELKATLIGSQEKTCAITRSKRRTYEFFKNTLPTPQLYTSSEELPETDGPYFLKPDVGQGSKGTALAFNRRDVDFYLSKDPTLLILEYLPGPEFTIDCFTDFNGRLRFCSGRSRSRVINGISVRTSIVENPEFRQMAEKINESIHLNGGWFFQVKQRADGTLVLLEIAPRIAGSSAIQRVRGVNLPLLSLYNQMQMPIQIEPQSFGVTVERAWSNRYRLDFQFNHVYVDFDDCLIQCGSVFPEMVRFLYQCINAGKSLHLLSRHAGNLTHRLQELRLASLFDTVTVVDRATPKSRYILQQDAIFIDDSFAERSEVHRTTGIPVFSIDALECLEC